MKVKCISIDAKGLIFKDNVSGLTVGKSYDAVATQSSFTDCVDESNIRFFLYNDNNEWEAYRPRYFAPNVLRREMW